jgi:diguanylate cyclase (GGDEF)-like protein
MPPVPEDHESPAALDRALGSADTGAVATAFWLGHLQAGLVLYGVATLVAAGYLLLTPDGPHRALEWAMVGVSIAATLVVIGLPRRAIARSPRRLYFFFGWSAFSCVFVGTVAALDHGLRSPLAILLLIPATYASLAYPVRPVVGVGAVAVGTAIVTALVAGDTLAHTVVFVGTVGMVTLLSAWVTHARGLQQEARRRLTHRLVELARHDGLTGCLNHRAFYEQVSDEVERAKRHGHAASLLVLDIDDFKSINDTHGHLVGDDVLRGIGSVLQHSTRSIDAVGRIGGDEFAVLVVETTEPQVRATAARIRNAVREMEAPVAVAVTVGVAHVAHPDAGLSPHELVALADADLYQLKRQAVAPEPLGGAQPI